MGLYNSLDHPELELHECQDRYQKESSISKGGFGIHDLCLDTETNQLVVLKFIVRGDRITHRLQRQIVNQHGLFHPHVTNLEEAFLLPSYLVLVLEYVANGSLAGLINKYKKISEEEARWYFQQLAFALDYLHREGVAHRDLRLEHILLSHEEYHRPLVKLTGFGLSKHERFQSKPHSYAGTIQYMSPEVLKKGGSGLEYDGKAVDMWTIGIILYVIMVGDFPFKIDKSIARDPKKVLELIEKTDVKFPASLQASPNVQNLLDGLLKIDMNDRLSARQVLEHPWIMDGLPKGAEKMNDSIPSEVEKLQSRDEIKEILKEARSTVKPDHVWDDSEYTYDDHQIQSMDPDEVVVFLDGLGGPERKRLRFGEDGKVSEGIFMRPLRKSLDGELKWGEGKVVGKNVKIESPKSTKSEKSDISEPTPVPVAG